ncbi:hypothetical protein FE783_10110 [Paenibacillus mesophilus]|uniref:glycosyl hydrolase family 28-related protein n=1 Tax=Paenibacillus mesophilus TaxID=2582849 RepID=UPI00110DCF38|nr:glycosyl hydrolase family 28-related protein [Paenibacillus mesophilus]TMV49921.1 hypothetical protein FE783_10110 [Paenibacillus mesophilus]
MKKNPETKNATEKNSTIEGLSEQAQAARNSRISRRKLLASIAVTGAAVVAGGMSNAVRGEASVSSSVYGNGDDKNKKPKMDADNVTYRFAVEQPERIVSDKLREWISVRDFGAKGDVLTNDTAAFQTAIDWARSEGRREIYIPAGTYHVPGTLTNVSSVVLIGDNVRFTSGSYKTYSLSESLAQINTISRAVGVNVVDYQHLIPNQTADAADWDWSPAFQGALNEAKTGPVQVIVPSGTYKLKGPLKVYRNTHLKLNMATLVRSHAGAYLYNGDPGETFGGYDGHGNIVIEGGVFEGNIANFPSGYNAIILLRGRNITFNNVEIRDIVGGHAVDMNACEDVSFYKCRFLGFRDHTGNSAFREAIQISNQTSDSLGSDPNGFGVNDGTPCRNIRVTDCYFGASGTTGMQAWAAGIGNHSAVHNLWNHNIKVHGCTFEGMTYAGIRLFKFSDVDISGNTFIGCTRGVKLDSAWGGSSLANRDASGLNSKLPQAGKNIHIANNIFKDIKNESVVITGAVFGTIAAYYDNVSILGNMFDHQGIMSPSSNANVIYLSWASHVKIDHNSIKKGYRGVYLAYVADVIIGDSNSVTDVTADGMLVTEHDVSFNVPIPGEPGYDASITAASVKTWYKSKGYTTNIQIGRSRLKRIGRTGVYLNYVWGFKIDGVTIDSAATATDADRDAIRIENNARNGEILFPTVIKNRDYTSGTGGANRYAVNVLSSCQNIRLQAGELEGKGSQTILLAGTNVWNGYYIFAPNGARYKATIGNDGLPVYTIG